jgi:hypothetical protein
MQSLLQRASRNASKKNESKVQRKDARQKAEIHPKIIEMKSGRQPMSSTLLNSHVIQVPDGPIQ